MPEYDPFGVNGGTTATATKGTQSVNATGGTGKSNAGRLYDPFSIGSVQAVPDPALKTQQKQQPQAPAAKPTSLFGHITNAAKDVATMAGHAGRAVGRPAVDVTTGQGGKLVHDVATLGSSDVGKGGFNATTKMVNQGAQEGKQVVDTAKMLAATRHIPGTNITVPESTNTFHLPGTNINVGGTKDPTAFANAQKQSQKDYQNFKQTGGLFNAGTITNPQESQQGTAKGAAKIGADTAGAATEIVPFAKGAEAAKAAEEAVKAGKLAKAGEVGVNAAKAGAINAGFGSVSSVANQYADNGKVNLKQVAKDTGSSVAQGVGLDLVGHVIGTAVGKGVNALGTDGAKKALQTAKQNTLLNMVKDKGLPTPTTSNAKVNDLIKTHQAIEQQNSKPAEAAATQAKATQAEADKAQVQGQKIDRQVELIQAKKADNAGTLSNVDQTKLSHLQEDKQQLTGVQEPPSIKVFGKTIPMTEDNGFKATSTKDGGIVYSKTAMRGNNARGDRQAITHFYTSDGNNITRAQHDAMVNGDLSTPVATASKVPGVSVPKDQTVKTDSTTTKPIETTVGKSELKVLTPVETAHMEPVNGYTHSTHMAQDYADMLRSQEQSVKGGQLIKNADGTYRRTSEHSQFFRDFYKENGKAPTKADYAAEAQRQLESGKAPFGASKDYKTLQEREHQPIPRQEVNITSVTGTNGTKTSKLAQSVESKAVAAKLTKSLGDLPQYSKVDMKEQGRLAADLLANEEQKANNIALGHEAPPANILPEAVYTAVAQKAAATNDIEMLKQLANSSRVGEATAMGQRIRALAELNPNDPVSGIKSVQDARAAAFEAKNKTTVAKAQTSEIQQIRAAKATVPKVSKESFASFVDSLKC